VLLAALATHTSHIGLVLTAPALYGDTATLAREIASLDHVSRGRGAWNIITSQHEHGRKILGAGSELARSAKYDKADEYVTIVTQLWESLPPEAIVADAASTTYVDAGRLRPVEFQGDYYQASGVLGVVGGYQGRRPVLLRAGASESSKQFGSKWADALFTSHWMKPSAQEFYTDVKQYAAQKWQRDPEKLLVVPGVYPVLGARRWSTPPGSAVRRPSRCCLSTSPAATGSSDLGGGGHREPGAAGRRRSGQEPDAQLLPRDGAADRGRAGHPGRDRRRVRQGLRRDRDQLGRGGAARAVMGRAGRLRAVAQGDTGRQQSQDHRRGAGA
jgi:hypothetical protein